MALAQSSHSHKKGDPMSVYQFGAKSIDGKGLSLSSYKDKVLLIVNVASKCGHTPQYAGLEKLYKEYHGKGLVILGFPCDQFGHQEPGDSAQIKTFCSSTYGVTFPLFSKIEVNGPQTHPLYKFLENGKDIAWNFTKFLIDRKGHVLQRFEPSQEPESLEANIREALTAK